MGRLKEATDQNAQLIALLHDVTSRLDDDEKRRVNEIIDGITNKADSTTSMFSDRDLTKSNSPSEVHSGEALATSSAVSNEDIEHLDEDLFKSHSSRATGFVGQNSVVQWLRSLNHQGVASHSPDPPVAESTFYVDSESLGINTPIEASELPPVDTAERLFGIYIDVFHGMFPLVPSIFQDQFRDLVTVMRENQRIFIPERWQALLNIIFAISARYSYLVGEVWYTNERDHLVYMNRALRLLQQSSSGNFLVAAPDLLLIQTTGLLSIYYLVIGHVSKAWIMMGISIRYAVAVGMHVQNDDPSASPAKKETLVQTWWSLQLAECLLSCMTGRPWVISDNQCNVPIKSFADASGTERKTSVTGQGSYQPTETHPNSGGLQYTFLEARVHISLIMQKALSLLYAPLIQTSYSWTDVQKSINSLIGQLSEWTLAALGSSYDDLNPRFEFLNTDIDRERLVLHFHLFSTQVLITRPCLCRLEDRTKQQQPSVQSLNFNRNIAAACIQAAQNLTSLFPDEPQPEWIYKNGPWWCIVHNIMQAATVFLVELSKRGRKLPNATENISTPLKKLVRWLRAMRYQDVVARRAYKVVFDILKTSAHRNQFDISDLLAEDETESSFLPDIVNSEFHPTSWQGQDPTPSYVDPAIMAVDPLLQLPNDPMEYQPTFLLDNYQTPPLYGNPYATPFDSTDVGWSPSFDSFFQSHTVPQDNQPGPSKS